MNFKYVSKDIDDTLTIAENVESEKFPNMVICLDGDLGSGKTVFTKGFAQALGIEENITSPTFNIIKEYNTEEMNLYHMDLYRLEGDVRNLGLEEYFEKGGVVIIEWADMIQDYLPEERLEIRFKVVDEDTRVLIFKPYGTKYEEICEAIL